MHILYQTNWLKKACMNAAIARRLWGAPCAAKLAQRLDELEAAYVLADIRNLPGPKCHELAGSMSGMLSVHLSGGLRLVFEPADAIPPRKPDGGLDWTKVTAIRLLKVVDYH
ncbi:MAG: killer suppression protein [Chloroflexi bacterium]|nr:killer suppression protein [Chloroflexota bacterium]OPZ65496.1 MAG: hypothetical protein BWY85_00527 [Firmicutes bacterium ADurb.Bin506]